MNKGKIYKIVNIINNKVYIGKTTSSISQRFQRHINDSKRLNTKLARAIKKYNESNFVITQIEECDISTLDKREKYWIDFYTKKIGKENMYNMTSGGDGGNTYLDKNESEMNEIKHKISLTKKYDKNPNHTPVKALNVLTKEIIHFSTLKEMQEFFGEKNHNFIVRRCKNKTKCLYKKIWNFAYESNEFSFKSCNKNNRKKQNIIVTDLTNNEVKSFDSYANAEEYYGLRNKYFSSKAYRYDKEFTKGNYKIIKQQHVSTTSDECKKVESEISTGSKRETTDKVEDIVSANSDIR